MIRTVDSNNFEQTLEPTDGLGIYERNMNAHIGINSMARARGSAVAPKQPTNLTGYW